MPGNKNDSAESTKKNYSALEKKLEELSKWWHGDHGEFSRMAEAFGALKYISGNVYRDPFEKLALYDTLTDRAAEYTGYKKAQEKRSAFENRRIDLAEEMSAYAQSMTEWEAAYGVATFLERTRRLTSALSRRPDDPDAKVSLLREKDNFLNVYRQLAGLAEKHPENETLTQLCRIAFSDKSISLFETQYASLSGEGLPIPEEFRSKAKELAALPAKPINEHIRELMPPEAAAPEAVLPRHINAELDGDAAKVGAALSSRMAFDLEDEAGNVTRGFFTKNSFADLPSIFREKAEKEIPGRLLAKFDRIHETISRNASNESLSGLFTRLTDYAEAPKESEKKADEKPLDIDEARKKRAAEEKIYWQKTVARAASALKSQFHIPDEFLTPTVLEDPEFREYLDIMLQSVRYAHSLQDANISMSNAQISEGGNINRRNNAMSDFAEYLGIGSVIARSTPMTLKLNGTVINGSFMVGASGISYDDVLRAARTKAFAVPKTEPAKADAPKAEPAKASAPGAEPAKAEKPKAEPDTLSISGSGLKSLSRLEFVDTLCANKDRHGHNMFYTVERIKGKLQITGVQGIDNDASFGEVYYKSGTKYRRMSPVEDIKVIDKELAERVMSVTAEKTDEYLKTMLPAGVSGPEMDAARKRLADLQYRIRNNKIKICNDEDWEKLSVSDLKKYRKEYADEKYTTFANVFATADLLCQSYNKALTDPSAVKDDHQDAVLYELPTARCVGTDESMSLKDHLEYLNELNADYLRREQKAMRVKYGTKYPGDEERNVWLGTESVLFKKQLENTQETLSAVLDQMENNRDRAEALDNPKEMTPEERDTVLTSLKQLHTVSTAMAEAYRSERIKNTTSFAEGLARRTAAYCEYSQDSIRKDAVRSRALAERRSPKADLSGLYTVPAAKKLSFDTGKTDKVPDYSALKNTLAGVNKWWQRSTDTFDRMANAFAALDKIKQNKLNRVERQILYTQLAERAQAYADYKSKQTKLSDFEMKRRNFAIDAAAYARAMARSVTNSRTADHDAVRSAAIFMHRCKSVAQTALQQPQSTNDTANDRAAEILQNDRGAFRKGFMHIMELSAKHPNDQNVQYFCSYVLTSPALTQYRKAALDAENRQKGAAEKETDFYRLMGISPLDKQKAEILSKLANKSESREAFAVFRNMFEPKPPAQSKASAERKAVFSDAPKWANERF